MISCKREVQELLTGIGRPIYYFYPKDWCDLPMLSWCESQNRALARADGREVLTELRYDVTAWAVYPSELDEIAAAADEALTGAGFARESAVDSYEQGTGFHRRRTRYRIVCDLHGKKYQ